MTDARLDDLDRLANGATKGRSTHTELPDMTEKRLRLPMPNRASLLAVMALTAAAIPPSAYEDFRPVRIRPRRGNKYRLCECGSHKLWADCCALSSPAAASTEEDALAALSQSGGQP